MSTHTPGPWAWNNSTDIYQKDTGFTVIEIAGKPKIDDTRLISAAPELLEAVQLLMEIVGSPSSALPTWATDEEIDAAWKLAEWAVIKATGKEQA